MVFRSTNSSAVTRIKLEELHTLVSSDFSFAYWIASFRPPLCCFPSNYQTHFNSALRKLCYWSSFRGIDHDCFRLLTFRYVLPFFLFLGTLVAGGQKDYSKQWNIRPVTCMWVAVLICVWRRGTLHNFYTGHGFSWRCGHICARWCV